MNVAVLIYPNVELVDMNGPINVFLHANEIIGSTYYNIYTVAKDTTPLLSEGGVVTITPQYNLGNCPSPDIVVIPGIMDNGVPGIAGNAEIAWITEMVKGNKLILSVCIGTMSLAKTGLLSGRQATTHYLSIGDLHKQYPDIIIVKNVRYIQDGNIVTTGGVTSGIDGALYLVNKFNGEDVAQEAADIMVYNRDAPLPPYTILPPYYS